MNDIPRVDPQVRLELAREAKGLLDDKAFSVALATLQRQWYGELLLDDTTDDKARNLRAKLQALESIPQILRGMMAAHHMPQRGTNVR